MEDRCLSDGSRIGVIGGGPAGSFTAYFLLKMAETAGIDLSVTIYESRDFSRLAPHGCNMCGGIISETLVQNLAAEGMNLPESVIQRGIESYTFHTDVGSVKIDTPLHEKRIAAVYRGSGPRDAKGTKWKSFDLHVLELALSKGARLVAGRVDRVELSVGRPRIAIKGEDLQTYDLLVAAVGANSPALKLFRELEFGYQPPKTTKAFIREYYLGEELVSRTMGSSMQVYLLDIPRLDFGAIIPKGDYVTVCLLGDDIDTNLVDAFLNSSQVKSCLPPGWSPGCKSCQCAPSINIAGAVQPFSDRIVFVGDCVVTRLYKDGIGAAYRTAKACATTAVFQGIARKDFEKHFWPVCQAIRRDNAIGRTIFATSGLLKRLSFARKAIVRMTRAEQMKGDSQMDMSQVLWDMFSGSAPYRDILRRALSPRFLSRLAWELLTSPFPKREPESHALAHVDQGVLGREYQEGDTIVRQGDTGDCMYMIQEGLVEVLAEGPTGETQLRVAEPGEFLGEMAIFEHIDRTVTLRAMKKARVLTIDKKNFLQRIHEDPSLAFRLVETMSRRVRGLSDQVARSKA